MGNIIIRLATSADATAIAHVNTIGWQTAYRNIFPKAFLDNLDIAECAEGWHKRIASGGAIYVALDEVNTVGFISVGKFRGDSDAVKGEVYAIYIHPDYQGKAIGRMLFEAGRKRLNDKALMPFGVWVIDKNPAHHFYRTMGGALTAERQQLLADTLFTEWLFVYP